MMEQSQLSISKSAIVLLPEVVAPEIAITKHFLLFFYINLILLFKQAMQQQIEAKQRYLREHIIDENYDPQDFAEFCVNDIGNIDINTWNYQDLQNIVKKYKESKKKTEEGIHQTSFIKYQQQEDHPKPQSENIQSKIQINHDEIKEIFKSPNRQKQENQQTIDQLFKDPFSKIIASPHKQNAWFSEQPKSSANQFNFMNILGTPNQQIKQQFKKNDKQFQNIFSNFPIHTTNIQNQNSQKIKPNFEIFDMNFNQIIKQTPKVEQKKNINPNIKISQNKPDESAFIKKIAQIPVKQETKVPQKRKKSQKIEIQINREKIIQKAITTEKKNKIKYEGLKIIKEDFQDIVPCIKAISRSLLTDPNIQIQITGHQIVNRNFFVPDYVLYYVYTKGINIEVKRKYNHFLRLRNLLAKFYPGYRLPYLQKNGWLSQTDIQFIKKQKIMINYFMNDIIMNKEFKNCRIVEQFLTFKDNKALKQKFQQYENMPKLKSIEELCLLKGQISLRFTDDHRIYSQKLEIYLETMEANIQKYKKLCQQLTSNYSLLLKTFADINEVIASIELNTKIFNSSVQINEFYDLQKTFHRINDIYKEMGNNIKFEMKVLENDIKPLMRFQKQNFNTIRELNDIKNNMTNTFMKLTDTSKNQLYKNNKKLDQFKISIDEPSKNYVVLKYQTAFYNSQSSEQNMRMFNDLSLKLNKKFIGIATMYEQKWNQVIGFWRNIKTQGLK